MRWNLPSTTLSGSQPSNVSPPGGGILKQSLPTPQNDPGEYNGLVLIFWEFPIILIPRLSHCIIYYTNLIKQTEPASAPVGGPGQNVTAPKRGRGILQQQQPGMRTPLCGACEQQIRCKNTCEKSVAIASSPKTCSFYWVVCCSVTLYEKCLKDSVISATQ